MTDRTMPILETERLSLCQLKIEDAPFIYELLNSPEWIQYIGDREIRTLDDARNYIEKGPMSSYSRNGFGLYLTRLKTDDTPIGLCGLIKRETLAHPDIGFAFLSEFMGKGFAFESASAVLKQGKTSLGLETILAITDTNNQRSIKLLKRLGLLFEKTITLPPEEKELLLFSSKLIQVI